ncbi:hypothetical protein SLH46_03910 [Draconibacterium sp. IB214405]|uniref:hypothetical protein n=1 Tax=Draconibacterium sp. IB214405 TaxID=3097352 RepID=UPI002A132213|nr:hypothetical protein [Draconibacterium sp. IB214405]MDX8338316.1 hypothetical protein [Draconibacterium sp. IB214405]
MKISAQYLVLLILIIFVSCGPSDEDKARVKIDLAKNLLAKNDTAAAINQLDSISILFPEAVYSANAAKNLLQEVRFQVMQRKEAELDSVEVQVAELEKSFVKEKTEFDRYTQYIHKRQTFKRAWDRSYIQVHLDERGELYLSSNYHGENWLNHTGLRVYDSGDDAKTEEIPVGSTDNHRSDFMEAKWEKVSYRNGKDNGVMEFIANNVDRNLKAVFLGKEYYYIILETYDKEAVRDALALSKAIKKRNSLEQEIKALGQKINIQ